MRKILSLFLVIGLLGCGDVTGLASDVAGTYRLDSFNGEPVPVLVSDDGFTQTWVLQAEMIVRSNGTFTEVVDVEVIQPGHTSQSREQYTGTWSGSRSTLRFRYDTDGSVYDAEYLSPELVLYDNFDEIVYVRR